MPGELKNCPRCGAVFVQALRSICTDCFHEEEKDFQMVYDYIRKRENRQATVTAVVEATGVAHERITQFVKEKRLLTTHFPNLHYKCDRCGGSLQQGRLCDGCRTSLHKEWQRVDEKSTQDDPPESRTYYSLKRGKK
ncbi:flagellar operon protein TIGR03826 [Thalassobacillus cyri]|uniref:Flagellar operon protein TIGR03826 n=1 Tax=Thalassobacillus cyri TaxID=571932 RepID=A0A1H4ATX8_9BACI|nr:TIGR03826 family flagellar region protein [Thalassobacillus cyri]SEA39326.1 flagellar operon protein TIGR03826 [Thalassobacillus cyri]